MPARKNGFSIVKSNSREDSPLYVKISVRNEKGHPTSKLIGAIGRKSSFSSDEEIEKRLPKFMKPGKKQIAEILRLLFLIVKKILIFLRSI